MKKLYIEPTTEALELTLGSSLLNNFSATDMDIIVEEDVWEILAI